MTSGEATGQGNQDVREDFHSTSQLCLPPALITLLLSPRGLALPSRSPGALHPRAFAPAPAHPLPQLFLISLRSLLKYLFSLGLKARSAAPHTSHPHATGPRRHAAAYSLVHPDDCHLPQHNVSSMRGLYVLFTDGATYVSLEPSTGQVQS